MTDEDDFDPYVPPTLEEQLQDLASQNMQLNRWKTIVANLDRCPHGRHASDSCAGWRGPGDFDGGCRGGRSLGNPALPPGTVIGIDYSSTQLIRVPHGRDAQLDPKQWYVPRAKGEELHHYVRGETT